nr:ribonuclease H-like domain-containing protein [Tanacetum cinerariifolium]
MSWTGLPEFEDDTITNYSRPSPSIESDSSNLQNNSSFVSENGESTSSILSKLKIKFMKAADSPTVIITNKNETVRKPSVKYAKMATPRIRLMTKATGTVVSLVVKASADKSELWHKRLGHLNFKTKNKLVRYNLVRGLPSKCFENDHTYATCLKGKQHKASCKTKLVHSMTKPLHTLHMDLFGPTSVSSLNHKWYCLVVTDDFSRFTWTFFLKSKDETSGILRNFITEIENLKDLKVKIIRCDNGGEFKNTDMNDFCSRKGIKREFSNARTPQQNRVAKRRNRTLIKAARTMLADAKLPVTFWAEAVNTARKFKTKGDEGYFIRYSMSSKAFRVFNKRTKRVEENLHIDFLENKLIEKGAGPNWLFDIDTLTSSMNYVPVVFAGTTSTNFSGTKDAASQDVKKHVSSLRYIALPNWFHEAHLESSTSNAQDACKADAPESSGISNPIATSTDPLANQIETLTVETLIPIGHYQDDIPSLDNILTLTNRFKDILRVTTNTGDTNGVEANLSNIENNISNSLTPTFKIHKDHPISQIIGPVDTLVQTKNKSKEMEEQSFIASIHHKTDLDLLQFFLFACFLSQEEPKKIYDALKDPNDIIFGSSNPQLCSEFKALTHEKFQMSAMGELNFFLGLHVLQKKDGIFLSQDKYVGDILKKFGYSNVRSANTPMDKENPWGKDGNSKDVDLHLYRSIIRSLMYLTASRPDIMFTVCTSARHQVTPKECHLHTVKRIFRYLKIHPKLGIWYPNDSPFDLVAYSDSNYGGATQDRKSTTRGCQFLDRRLISWQCKKQTIVATSTTEAEYVAAASGCRQVLYALSINPTVYVSHIRQFWSTARIETTDEGTKILATIDGYNILPNQKFTFQKGQFSHQWKYLIHTIIQCLSPKSTGFNEFSSNIATVVGEGSGTPTETHHTPFPEAPQSPQHDLLSSIHPPVTTEKIPTVIPTVNPPLRQYSKRARIAHSSALPTASLKARVKMLEDKDGGVAEPSRDDATIKGRSLETMEEAAVDKSTKKDSNDTKELVNVLTSLDAENILTSGGVQVVSIPPAAEVSTISVPTSSGMVPTTSLIFTTGSVVTPYARRKGKEKMVESETPKKKKKLQEQIYIQMAREIEEQLAREDQRRSEQIPKDAEIARIHAEEELQILIDGLDRNNETIAKYLQDYEQFATDLSIRERIELINDLVKTSEEVSEEDLKEMMQLIPVEEVYVEALQVRHQIIDWDIHTEDLIQLWTLVKETLSIRQATSDKDKELWVELKRLFEPDVEDQLWTHTQALMYDLVE